jgi:hypothetical protein
MKIILLLSLTILFYSCNEANTKKNNTNFVITDFETPLVIIEVDSCQYLFGDWGYAAVLTHKGNCKFCAKRNKKI